MAKPISAIPELKGKNAEAFTRDINSPKITKAERKTFEELKEFERRIKK